jgi:hypothetical protein
MLEQHKTLLTQHYPDCPPLRALMRKIDAAIGYLGAWDDPKV